MQLCTGASSLRGDLRTAGRAGMKSECLQHVGYRPLQQGQSSIPARRLAHGSSPWSAGEGALLPVPSAASATGVRLRSRA